MNRPQKFRRVVVPSWLFLIFALLATVPARAADTQPFLTDTHAVLAQQMREIAADGTSLDKLTRFLADSMRCNLVVNWRALEIAGVTHDTPISFSLHNVSFEEILHAIVEVTPTKAGTRLDYTASEGVIVITTDAELGKGTVEHVFDVTQPLSIGYDIKPDPTRRTDNAITLITALSTELENTGEITTGKNRDITLKDHYLAVTTSPRGMDIASQTLALFSAPTRIGDIPQGARLTPAAKKTSDALAKLPPGNPLDLLQDPHKFLPDLNYLYLPGTDHEVAKSIPQLDYEIDDAGTLLIGPAATMEKRVILAVYDLRPLLKRMAILNQKGLGKSPDTLIDTLKQKAPAHWDTMGLSSSSMIPHGGLLIVFARPAVHRAIAAALAEMYK